MSAPTEQRCYGACFSEHRQGLGRRWCFDCGEWCYADELCARAEIPRLEEALKVSRDRIEWLEEEVRRLSAIMLTAWPIRLRSQRP